MKTYPTFRAWCDSCGTEFKVPSSIPDSPELIMRSESLAHHVLVNVDADTAYNEVYDFVCKHPEFGSRISSLRVQLARKIFASFCDPAPDGTSYSFYFPEKCPKCNSSGLHYGPVGVPQPMSLSLEYVRHSRWGVMSASEKSEAILIAGGTV
jgi:hypothetical protein